MPARPVVQAALLALVAAACVAPGATVDPPDGGGGLEQPTFRTLEESPRSDPPRTTPPSELPSGRPSPATSPTSPPGAVGATTAPAAEGGQDRRSVAPEAAPPAVSVRGTIEDGAGDLSGLQAGNAPAHADLRRVELAMGSSGRITITFAGSAPEAAEGDQVLNVATYHDVTGDGQVDYELWASLTADGWGTAWYDLRAGTSRFAADDDVEVEVVDGSVVLTFPTSHLGDARSGQWLASSEWGTPLTISSGTASTDDAPDDRGGRRWPS